ncbi:MAG: hypothetical protein QOH39_3368 [Verrucomicrobiota bacterium]|jgi:hypothetical protein
MKTKEEIIRDEIRSFRQIAFDLCKWGVSVLAALQAAIFLIRKEVYDYLTTHGELDPKLYHYLPWDRYLIGTGALFMVASIFFIFTVILGRRYRFYHQLLEQHAESGLPIPKVRGIGRFLMATLYFTFPALDVAVRLYIRIHFELQLHP